MEVSFKTAPANKKAIGSSSVEKLNDKTTTSNDGGRKKSTFVAMRGGKALIKSKPVTGNNQQQKPLQRSKSLKLKPTGAIGGPSTKRETMATNTSNAALLPSQEYRGFEPIKPMCPPGYWEISRSNHLYARILKLTEYNVPSKTSVELRCVL